MFVKTLLYNKVCLAPPLFNTVHVVALPPPENSLIFKLQSKTSKTRHPIFSIAYKCLSLHSFSSLTLIFPVSSFRFIWGQPKIRLLNAKIILLNQKIMSLNREISLLTSKIILLNSKIILLTFKILLLNRKILLLTSKISLLNRKIILLNRKISFLNSKILLLNSKIKLVILCSDTRKLQLFPFIHTYSYTF